jgi:hypothetical protein
MGTDTLRMCSKCGLRPTFTPDAVCMDCRHEGKKPAKKPKGSDDR